MSKSKKALTQGMLKRFFRSITKQTVKDIVFIRELNDDETLWECKNENVSIAVVTCEDFISTYADSLDMYDEAEVQIGVGRKTEIPYKPVTKIIFT